MAQKLLEYDDIIDTAKKKILLDKIAPKITPAQPVQPQLPGSTFQTKQTPLQTVSMPSAPVMEDTVTSADVSEQDKLSESLRRIQLNQEERAKREYIQGSIDYAQYISRNNLVPTLSAQEALGLYQNAFTPPPAPEEMGLKDAPQYLAHQAEEAIRRIPENILKTGAFMNTLPAVAWDKATEKNPALKGLGNSIIDAMPYEQRKWLKDNVFDYFQRAEDFLVDDQFAQDAIARYKKEFGNKVAEPWLDIAGKVVGTTTDQAPQIVLGALINPALGMAYLFQSATTNSYQELLKQGETPSDAFNGALISGSLEVATEKLFGGIPGLGKGWLSEGLEPIITKAAIRAAKTPAGRAAIGKLVDVFGEGVEEYLSTTFEDGLQAIAKGRPMQEVWNEIKQDGTSSEALESFFLGAMSSLLLQGMEAGVGKGLMTFGYQKSFLEATPETQQKAIELINQALGYEMQTAGIAPGGRVLSGVTTQDQADEADEFISTAIEGGISGTPGKATVRDGQTQYESATGKQLITVNPFAVQGKENLKGKTARTALEVVTHEATHGAEFINAAFNQDGEVVSIKSPEYQKLIQTYLDYLTSQDEYDQEYNRIASLYKGASDEVIVREMFTDFVQRKVFNNYEMLFRMANISPSLFATIRKQLYDLGVSIAGTEEQKLIVQLGTVFEHILQVKADARALTDSVLNRTTPQTEYEKISDMGRTLYEMVYPEKAKWLKPYESVAEPGKAKSKKAAPKLTPEVNTYSVNGQTVTAKKPDVYNVAPTRLNQEVVRRHNPEAHATIQSALEEVRLRATDGLMMVNPVQLEYAQDAATRALESAGVANAAAIVATTFAENAHKRPNGRVYSYNLENINGELWQTAARFLLEKAGFDAALAKDGNDVVGFNSMMFSIGKQDTDEVSLSESQRQYFAKSKVTKNGDLIKLNVVPTDLMHDLFADELKNRPLLNKIQRYREAKMNFMGDMSSVTFIALRQATDKAISFVYANIERPISNTEKTITFEQIEKGIHQGFDGYEPSDYDYMFEADANEEIVAPGNGDPNSELGSFLAEAKSAYDKAKTDVDFMWEFGKRLEELDNGWHGLSYAVRYGITDAIDRDGIIIKDGGEIVFVDVFSGQNWKMTDEKELIKPKNPMMYSINDDATAIEPGVYEEPSEPEEFYVQKMRDILMPGFNSGMLKLILDKMQSRVLVKDAIRIASAGNKEEYEWSGVQEYLESLPPDMKISRASVIKVMSEHYPSFGITELAERKTQYSGYTRVSDDYINRNYREHLLMFNNPYGRFTQGHFGASGYNMMMHIRSYEMFDEQGQRQIFIDEIQSDWHQGRGKNGYANRTLAEQAKRRVDRHSVNVNTLYATSMEKLMGFVQETYPGNGIVVEFGIGEDGRITSHRVIPMPIPDKSRGLNGTYWLDEMYGNQENLQNAAASATYLRRIYRAEQLMDASMNESAVIAGVLGMVIDRGLAHDYAGHSGVTAFRDFLQQDQSKIVMEFGFTSPHNLAGFLGNIFGINEERKNVGDRGRVHVTMHELIGKQASNPKLFKELTELRRDFMDEFDKLQQAKEDVRKMENGVPDAPFKTTWADLAGRIITHLFVKEGRKRIYLADDFVHINRWGGTFNSGDLVLESRYVWSVNVEKRGYSLRLGRKQYALLDYDKGLTIENVLDPTKDDTILVKDEFVIGSDGELKPVNEVIERMHADYDRNQSIDKEDIRKIVTDVYAAIADADVTDKANPKYTVKAEYLNKDGEIASNALNVNYDRYRPFRAKRAFGFTKFYAEKMPSVMSKVLKKYGISMQSGTLSPDYRSALNAQEDAAAMEEALDNEVTRVYATLYDIAGSESVPRSMGSVVEKYFDYLRDKATHGAKITDLVHFDTFLHDTVDPESAEADEILKGYNEYIASAVDHFGDLALNDYAGIDPDEYIAHWLDSFDVYENEDENLNNPFLEYFLAMQSMFNKGAGETETDRKVIEARTALTAYRNDGAAYYKYFEISEEARKKITDDGMNMFSITEDYQEELASALKIRLEERLNNHTPAKTVLGIVNNGKAEEAYWSGMQEWLESLPPEQLVSKQEVMEHFNTDGISIRKVVLSENDEYGDKPKYTTYSLGKNQVEMVYQANSKALNKHLAPSYHWENLKNVFVHVRLSDLAPGHLIIDEIQSDIHQLASKRKGYAETAAEKSKIDRLRQDMDDYRYDVINDLFTTYKRDNNVVGELKIRMKVDGLPDVIYAPTVKSAVDQANTKWGVGWDVLGVAVDEADYGAENVTIEVRNQVTKAKQTILAKATEYASQRDMADTISLSIENEDPVNHRKMQTSQQYFNWYTAMVRLYAAMNENALPFGIHPDTTYKPPELPYRKETWWEFGFRESIKHAATQGYNRVYLTRGAIHALRFNDNSTDNIRAVYLKHENDEFSIVAYHGNNLRTRRVENILDEAEWNSPQYAKLRGILTSEEQKRIADGFAAKESVFMRLGEGRMINTFYAGMKKFYDEKMISHIKKFLRMYNQDIQYERINLDKTKSAIQVGVARLQNAMNDFTITRDIFDFASRMNGRTVAQNALNLDALTDEALVMLRREKQTPDIQVLIGIIESNRIFTNKAIQGYTEAVTQADIDFENSIMGELGTRDFLNYPVSLPYFEITDAMRADVQDAGTMMFSIKEPGEPDVDGYKSRVPAFVESLNEETYVVDDFHILSNAAGITTAELALYDLDYNSLKDIEIITKQDILDRVKNGGADVYIQPYVDSHDDMRLLRYDGGITNVIPYIGVIDPTARRIAAIKVRSKLRPNVVAIQGKYNISSNIAPDIEMLYGQSVDEETFIVEYVEAEAEWEFENGLRPDYGETPRYLESPNDVKEILTMTKQRRNLMVSEIKKRFNIPQNQQIRFVAVMDGESGRRHTPMTGTNDMRGNDYRLGIDRLLIEFRERMSTIVGSQFNPHSIQFKRDETMSMFIGQITVGTEGGSTMYNIIPVYDDEYYGRLIMRYDFRAMYDFVSQKVKDDLDILSTRIFALFTKYQQGDDEKYLAFPPLLPNDRRYALAIKEALRLAARNGNKYLAVSPVEMAKAASRDIEEISEARVFLRDNMEAPSVQLAGLETDQETYLDDDMTHAERMQLLADYLDQVEDDETPGSVNKAEMTRMVDMYFKTYIYGVSPLYTGRNKFKLKDPIIKQRDTYADIRYKRLHEAFSNLATSLGLTIKIGRLSQNGIEELKTTADVKKAIVGVIKENMDTVVTYVELTNEIKNTINASGQYLFSIQHEDNDGNVIDERIYDAIKRNPADLKERKDVRIGDEVYRRAKTYYHGSPYHPGVEFALDRGKWKTLLKKQYPHLMELPGLETVAFLSDSMFTSATYTVGEPGDREVMDVVSNFPYHSSQAFAAAVRASGIDAVVAQSHTYRDVAYHSYKEAEFEAVKNGEVAKIQSVYQLRLGKDRANWTLYKNAYDLLTDGVARFRTYSGQEVRGLRKGYVKAQNIIAVDAMGASYTAIPYMGERRHLDGVVLKILFDEHKKWQTQGKKYVPLDAIVFNNVIDSKFSGGLSKPTQTVVILNNQNWISDAASAKMDADTFYSLGTRSWEKTASASGLLRPIVVEDIDNDIHDGAFDYEPHTDKKAWSKAGAIIQGNANEVTKPVLDGAFDTFMALMNSGKRLTKDDIAVGERLITMYSQTEFADSNKVLELITAVSVLGTELGQQVQALSIINKLSPEGQLMYIMRAVKRMEGIYTAEHGGTLKITVSQELVDELLKQSTLEEIEIVIDKIKQNVADQVPASWVQKIDAWRYLAMLGNPKTHIRNIMGNAVFLPMAVSKDVVATILEQSAVGLGLMKATDRTHAVLGMSASDQELIKFAGEHWKDNKDAIMASGKYDFQADVLAKQEVFKTQWLEWLRRMNFKALDMEDEFFLYLAFTRNLAQYMKAQNLKPQTISKRAMQAAENYAIDEAKKLTFRDASNLANILNHLERTSGVWGYFIKAVLPFKKTPANILKRGLEYSPLSILTTIPHQFYKVHRGESTAAQAIDAIASGLTGTGIALLGAWLYGMGMLDVDEDEKEREKAYNRSMGQQRFSLVFPDGSNFTIDWIVPAVMPLFIGAQLASYMKQYNRNILYLAPEAMVKIFDPVFELTMLQGVTDTIQSFSQSGAAMVGEAATTAGANLAGQFFPTLGGQIARILDPIRRSTRAEKDSQWTPFWESLVRKLMNKIPGMSQYNEPMVDIRGEELRQPGDMITRVIANMVSPGYYSAPSKSRVDDEIQRLFGTTNDTALLPRIPDGTFTNESIDYILENEETTQFSKDLGKTTYDLMNRMLSTGYYRSAPVEVQSKLVKDIYEYAYYKAKDNALAGRNVAVSDKWYAKIKAAAKEGISPNDYLIAKSKYDTLEFDDVWETRKEAYAKALVQSGYTTAKIAHLMVAIGGYKVDAAYLMHLEYLQIMK